MKRNRCVTIYSERDRKSIFLFPRPLTSSKNMAGDSHTLFFTFLYKKKGFIFQLYEEKNRNMGPHLVLKWGIHLCHELVTIFLKHTHE